MNLLKSFVRFLFEVLKYFIGIFGTKKIYNFYKNTLQNNFSGLKADLNEQIKKIVKICAFALINVLLIFFAVIIFSLGFINILNRYFHSVYLGHLCVGGVLLISIFFINYFKNSDK